MGPFYDMTATGTELYPFRELYPLEAVDYWQLQDAFVRSYCTYAVKNWPRRDNVRLYMSRCWLRPLLVPSEGTALVAAWDWPTFKSLAQLAEVRGGRRAMARLLSDVLLRAPENWADREQLITHLAAKLPDAVSIQIKVYSLTHKDTPPFARAQALERLYWQKPGGGGYPPIFSQYIQVHAYTSAKRFYQQVAPLVTERVGFSSSIGPQRFTLALLENDQAGMRQALTDSSTGSAVDMIMTMVADVADDNIPALAAQVDG